MSAKKNSYHCVLFLQNEPDQKLLAGGTRLYGKLIPSTGTLFLTPYPPPPGSSISWLGIIQEKNGYEQEQPLLINVSRQGSDSWIARGFINNQQRVELPVKIVYQAACYARTPFPASEMDLLWKSTVTIIGCGTGGSKIALELARAGVGQIKLCDPQTVDYANISRYEGDLLDVGKPKVQAVAQRIYQINPAIRVEIYFEDIFQRPFPEIQEIMKSDLIVAATDKTAIQLLINELTQKLAIPGVFGGCYEEARGGEVLFTLPGKKMPCLACLRAGLAQPPTNQKIDYSTATGPQDYEGQPGLHAAVDLVTCVEIQICLGILLRNSPTSSLARLIQPDQNFLLVGGALGAGFYRFRKPFDIFFQLLSGPRKACPVCQHRNQLTPEVEQESIAEGDGKITIKREEN